MQIVSVFAKKNYRIIPILLGLWLIIDLFSHLGAEILWFVKKVIVHNPNCATKRNRNSDKYPTLSNQR
ncbi:MAG: hypothetical protein AAFX46_20725, partial [Cyanobacteria bacterium J06636_27]